MNPTQKELTSAPGVSGTGSHKDCNHACSRVYHPQLLSTLTFPSKPQIPLSSNLDRGCRDGIGLPAHKLLFYKNTSVLRDNPYSVMLLKTGKDWPQWPHECVHHLLCHETLINCPSLSPSHTTYRSPEIRLEER